MELDDQVRTATSLLVAFRVSRGQDDDTIRKGVAAAAKKAIVREFQDEYEQENWMALVQQSIEAELLKRRDPGR